MTTIFKLILVVSLFSNSTNILYGQSNTDNITLESATIRIADRVIPISSIISLSDNVLTWTQKARGNTSIIHFTITKSNGSLNTSTSQGSISYTLKSIGLQGNFKLEADATGVSAVLTLNNNETQVAHYIFDINRITNQ